MSDIAVQASCLLSIELIFENNETYTASYTSTATADTVTDAEELAINKCLAIFTLDAEIQIIKLKSLVTKTNQTFAVRAAI